MVSALGGAFMNVFFIFLILYFLAGLIGIIYLYMKIYGAAKFFLPDRSKTKKVLPSIGLLVLAILPALFSFVKWFVVIMHLIAFLILSDIAAIVAKKFSREKHIRFPDWMRIAYRSCAAALAMTLLIYIYAKYNMYHVVRTEYDVSINKHLSQPFTIVMIADLHYGLSLDADKLQTVVDSMQKESPDVVLLCGDIVDESTKYEALNEAFSVLGKTDSRFGTYYVYGNHDKSKYAENPHFTDAQLIDAIEGNGISILNDDTISLNEDVLLVGRADILDAEGNRKSIDELLVEQDKTKAIVVADHEPSDYDSLEKAGCDLVLSGHTHGGQVIPVGLINDLVHFSELNYGYIKQGNLNAIVSSGVAGWGFDLRTEHHSEYVVIHMTGEE